MLNRGFFSLRNGLLLIALMACAAPLFYRVSRSSASIQTLQARHKQLREALDRDDQPAAEFILRAILNGDPEAFAANNYDYLLGRLLEARGAGNESKQLFLRVVNRNSPLAGYAMWHM